MSIYYQVHLILNYGSRTGASSPICFGSQKYPPKCKNHLGGFLSECILNGVKIKSCGIYF